MSEQRTASTNSLPQQGNRPFPWRHFIVSVIFASIAGGALNGSPTEILLLYFAFRILLRLDDLQ